MAIVFQAFVRRNDPHPRLPEPALVRGVGARSGWSCSLVDLEFPHLPGTRNTRASGIAVFGERIWLNRDVVPVPEHHRTAPYIISGVSGIGMLVLFRGVFTFDLWPTVFGMALVYCGILWFVDRMAWLREDMKNAVPEFSNQQVQNDDA